MRPSLLLNLLKQGTIAMRKIASIFLVGAALGLHGCSSNTVKQEKILPEVGLNKTSEVVARVNGQPITEAAIKNLEIETAMYNRRLQVPRERLVEELIDRELLYQEAVEQGYDKAPAVADQIKVASRAIVSKAYMRTLVGKTSVSRKEVQAEYERRKKNTDLRQFRISHILATTEEQAIQLIGQLDKGENFQELARQFSKDSTSVKGGVLGWRGSNQMAPEMTIAVKQLKQNEYTKKPVKTSYGWHIVLLDEIRQQEAPNFDKQKDSLSSILKRKKLKQYIEAMKSKNTIEILEQAKKKVAVNPHAGH